MDPANPTTNSEINSSPPYFSGLELPPVDNTSPPPVKREWMDIPWKERNILSKICYVIAITFCGAVALFILWLIASVALNLLGKALGPWATQNLENNWWVWPVGIFLFLQRWFRILLFVVVGALISGAVLPIALDDHITIVEGFLIGAGICAVVSALCTFAPRPRFHKRNRKEDDK